MRTDEFDAGTDGWTLYEGASHDNKGKRSPSAVAVSDGIARITGDSAGTTGGMCWSPGQLHGRWEGRVRTPAADPTYSALLLLWPDADNFPEGGEIDFVDMSDPARQKTNFYLHHGADNAQLSGEVTVDATQWHTWAVEWTPTYVAAFVDGKEWHRSTDSAALPTGPMHLCVQLDWFPKGDESPTKSTMEIDWIKQYTVEGGSQSSGTPTTSESSDSSAADGESSDSSDSSDSDSSDSSSAPDSSDSNTSAPQEDNNTSINGAAAEDVWDRLADCESSGRWTVDTGNGYYGGLQFDKATWEHYGGTGFAPTADEASKGQQIAIAIKVRDDRGGYGSWPTCAIKLALPTDQ